MKSYNNFVRKPVYFCRICLAELKHEWELNEHKKIFPGKPLQSGLVYKENEIFRIIGTVDGSEGGYISQGDLSKNIIPHQIYQLVLTYDPRKGSFNSNTEFLRSGRLTQLLNEKRITLLSDEEFQDLKNEINPRMELLKSTQTPPFMNLPLRLKNKI